MLEKIEPPLRFALPKVCADGELIGYYVKFIRPLRSGDCGTAYEARLNGQRACVTMYRAGLDRYFTNPAKEEFAALQRVRADLFDAKQHLPRATGWLTDKFSGPLLATELIVDFDGQPSKSLAEVASVTPGFSARLREVLETIRDRQTILQIDPTKILVQRTQTGELNPIFIDVGSPNSLLRSLGQTIVSAILPDRHLKHLDDSIARALVFAESKVVALPPSTTPHSSDLAALTMPR